MSGTITNGVVGGGRTVKATVRKPGCDKKTVFRFLPAPKPGEGRAAKWLQRFLPLGTVIDEAHAVLQDGSALEVTGCKISDLYPNSSAVTQAPAAEELPAEQPKPEEPLPSKTAMRKMTPAALKAICVGRGIAVSGKTSKARMVAMLLGE